MRTQPQCRQQERLRPQTTIGRCENRILGPRHPTGRRGGGAIRDFGFHPQRSSRSRRNATFHPRLFHGGGQPLPAPSGSGIYCVHSRLRRPSGQQEQPGEATGRAALPHQSTPRHVMVAQSGPQMKRSMMGSKSTGMTRYAPQFCWFGFAIARSYRAHAGSTPS